MRPEDEDDFWDWDEPEEEPVIVTHTRQRMVTSDGTAMEQSNQQLRVTQTTKRYTIRDVNEAIDLLVTVFKGSGRNVLDEIQREVVTRVIGRSMYQKDAAEELGISARMMSYWRMKIRKQQKELLALKAPKTPLQVEEQDEWIQVKKRS
jgi:hypothetical protein